MKRKDTQEKSSLELQKEMVKKTKDVEESHFKEYLIGFIVVFIIDSLIAVTYILSSLGVHSFSLTGSSLYRVLCDGFSIPGIFTLLFWILLIVSSYGAFDAIAYGVKVAFFTVFYRSLKDTKVEKTYTEYVEVKRGKRKNKYPYMWINGLLFLFLGIIFLIIFNVSI